MARIRTIKPEFWTSEQVMDCQPLTRLLFIGLWNFVDDYGRAPVAPRTIKAQIMPGDECSGTDIQDMLNELNARGLILFYSADDKEYFEITGWSKHQKIDNPSKYKVCPAPFTDESRAVAITSEESQQIALEGKGEERKSKKEIRSVAKTTRPNLEFEKFKVEYPKRGASNPWQPALSLFEKALKSGVPLEAILLGAQSYRTECEKLRIIGTDKVAQAQTWLRQERYSDYIAQAREYQQLTAKMSTKVHLSPDDPGWVAWCGHAGKSFPLDKDGGWYFDSEYPPGYEPQRLAS